MLEELIAEIRKVLGEDLISEEVAKSFAQMIIDKMDSSVASLKESHEKEVADLKEAANAYGQQIYEDTTSKVTEYVDAAMQQFIKENKENFARLEENARAVEAIKGIKAAFEDAGFVFEKKDPDAELKAKLDEANSTVTTVMVENKSLKENLNEMKMKLIFNESTSSLALTQVEKVRTLSESVSYDGPEEYATTLKILIEQVLNETKAPSTTQQTPEQKPVVKNRFAPKTN